MVSTNQLKNAHAAENGVKYDQPVHERFLGNIFEDEVENISVSSHDKRNEDPNENVVVQASFLQEVMFNFFNSQNFLLYAIYVKVHSNRIYLS